MKLLLNTNHSLTYNFQINAILTMKYTSFLVINLLFAISFSQAQDAHLELLMEANAKINQSNYIHYLSTSYWPNEVDEIKSIQLLFCILQKKK